MLGAIYGDIVGSVYEFHNIRTKEFELFSEKSFFTDDSVMTLAVANALKLYDIMTDDISHSKSTEKPWADSIDIFKTFLISEMHKLAEKYPNAGYGGRFVIWLFTDQREPYNSFGNGSAMRVSPVAWYADSLEQAIDFATASAEVTHNHPEGIKGAVVTAGAAYLARTGATMEEIKDFVSKYYKISFTLDEIRPTYRFNETCQETVPQALQAFFESVSFEDAIRNAISIGGDSDTLAAITGAVAEAYYGMSEKESSDVISRLDAELLNILESFNVYYHKEK